tara:strand:+ start:181 stop:357 length:177 start_codon:yes stop_codon:yes gene_type:complete
MWGKRMPLLPFTKKQMILSNALTWISIPFVLSTIYFGIRKGENNYYETDKYDGNGTAH